MSWSGKGIFSFSASVLVISGFINTNAAWGALTSRTLTAAHTHEIRLQHRSFRPSAASNLMASLSSAKLNQAPRRYLLSQFSTLPSPQVLKLHQVRPLHLVAPNTIMLSVPSHIDINNLPNLHWVGTLAASDKLSKNAQQHLQLTPQDTPLTLLVESFVDSGAALAELVSNLGGSIQAHPHLPEHIQLVSASPATFRTLTQDNRIAWIFVADDTVLSGAPISYCAGAMTPYGSVANFVAPSTGWDGKGLGPASIRYHYLNNTAKISGTAENVEIERAFAVWASYADLTFTQINLAKQSRSIDILWATGAHGDNDPFDSSGGALAHAYFPAPGNAEPFAGDLHFDDAENWAIYGNGGRWKRTDIDVFTVALHEIGHTLGLDHSDTTGAVMAAFYGGPVSDLQADDIAGLRSIYSNQGLVDTSVPPPPSPTVQGCTTSGATTLPDPTLPALVAGSIGMILRKKKKSPR